MSLLMLSIANVVKAEGIELSNAPKVWTVPAVFTADQEVTFYYDVTDVGFPSGVDLYLWAWQPTEPDAGHGGNSSDFAKLEYLGDNIYKMTMTPTKYFNSPVSAFENSDWPGFWQRLKTKDGGVAFIKLPTREVNGRRLQIVANPIRFSAERKPKH